MHLKLSSEAQLLNNLLRDTQLIRSRAGLDSNPRPVELTSCFLPYNGMEMCSEKSQEGYLCKGSLYCHTESPQSLKVLGTQGARLLVSASCSSTVTYRQNDLICEVLGPTPPKLMLSLKLDNQAKVSKPEKRIRMPNPAAGMWQCVLNDEDKVLLDFQVDGEDAGSKA